jgi:hypothetical protein
MSAVVALLFAGKHGSPNERHARSGRDSMTVNWSSARCTNCDGKGATLQRPGWAGNHIGFYPFPIGAADEARKCSE